MSHNRKDFLKRAGLGGLSLITAFNYEFISRGMHVRIKPPKLEYGDTIGMISPAGSLGAASEYEEVVKSFEERGFKVKVGKHAQDHHGYLAGTDKNRAADLNTMFADSEVNAIIPFRGGWGSNRILEYIDFELIKKNPKPLIGYSDITSLLLAIYAKSGLITFHGPVGKSPWTDFTKSYFEQAVMNNRLFQMTNSLPANSGNEGITTILEGQASGVLLGGNLSVLTAMMGSDYLPDWDGSILFLEDVGEDVYRIDRMLTQLRLNGVFEKINGLVFGKCTSCDVSDGYHFTLEEVLNHHLEEFEIPAFMGANIGHINDMFTLPVGAQARMNANRGIISLLESPVKSGK